MAIPKKPKKQEKNDQPTNGDGTMAAHVAAKYPELTRHIERAALLIENVEPTEARKVSGHLRRVIAQAAKRRSGEAKAFRAEQKKVKAKERLAKLEAQFAEKRAHLLESMQA